jgi:hypothetical protein
MAFLVITSSPAPAAGIATSIPVASLSQPAEFWKAAMEHFYGSYDRRLKCWTAEIRSDDGPLKACMRPHKIETVNTSGGKRHFLVFGGFAINDRGGKDDCHACGGLMGMAVLEETGNALDLIARNDLATSFGSWGDIPPEEAFTLRRIGQDDLYGWVIETGYTGQGYTYLSHFIHAPIGDRIIEIGSMPAGFDDLGNCDDNGTNLMNGEKCTAYSVSLDFVENAAAKLYDAVMRYSGYRHGETIDPVFTAKFDDATLAYELPDGMPDD